MRIGIAGASGFLGSNILSDPSFQGQEILAFAHKAVSSPKNVEWIEGDLNNSSTVAEFVTRCDAVIYLAHVGFPVHGLSNTLNDVEFSLKPFLTVIKELERLSEKKKLIFISSGGAVYGTSTDKDHKFKETELCRPETSYGVLKLCMENYLAAYTAAGVVHGVSLRVSNPYGSLLNIHRGQGLIGVALNCLLTGNEFQIIGDPGNVRDYLHMSDMIAALQKTLALNTAEYQCINIGSSIGLSVENVLELLQKISGKRLKIKSNEKQILARLPQSNILDISLAYKLLGWSPSLNLNNGIKALWSQYSKT